MKNENGHSPNENTRRWPAGVQPALPVKLRLDKEIPSGTGKPGTGGGAGGYFVSASAAWAAAMRAVGTR